MGLERTIFTWLGVVRYTHNVYRANIFTCDHMWKDKLAIRTWANNVCHVRIFAYEETNKPLGYEPIMHIILEYLHKERPISR